MATGSLLGKADASLVKAATDAAMANVPVDVSRIHERVMRSRGRAMKSIGEAWVKGIGAIGMVGQKLVTQAKRWNAQKDLSDSYNEDVEKRIIVEDPKAEGEYKLEFDDGKINKLSDELNVLKLQSEKMSGYPGADKDYATNLDNQKRLEDKITKRTNRLLEKDFATRIYTDFEGNKQRIEPRTVDGQLKKIRKDILAIKRDKDDPKRQEKIKALRIKKDNLKSSVVNFRAQLQVVTEQLKLDNVDMMASSQGVDGPLRMQFVRALLAEGKPLGEDAGEYAGARAQTGFNEEGKMTFMFVDKYGMPIENANEDDMSIQIDDVQDLVIIKNPAIIEGFTAVTNSKDLQNRGYNFPGEAYDPSQTNNFINATVIDKNSALSAINHSSGDMTMSLADALSGVQYENGIPVLKQTEMSDFFWEELEAQGLGSEWDIDGGGVTATDFAGDIGEANFIKLRDEVLKGKDIPLVQQLLKANTNAQNEKYHLQGVEKYNAKLRAKTKTTRTGRTTKPPPEMINLFGKEIEAPKPNTAAAAQLATVQNITNDSPTVTVNGITYKRINGAGYDYRAIKHKTKGTIQTGGAEVTKEYLIREASPMYGGHIPDDFFGESTYEKSEKSVYDPMETSIWEMKQVLPQTYDPNASDEQIRKMFEKYVKSLMPQNQ